MKYMGEFPSLTDSTVCGWLKEASLPACSERYKFTNNYIWKDRTSPLFTWEAWQKASCIYYPYVKGKWNYQLPCGFWCFNGTC